MDYNKYSRHAVCFLIKTTSQDNLADFFIQFLKDSSEMNEKKKKAIFIEDFKIMMELKLL